MVAVKPFKHDVHQLMVDGLVYYFKRGNHVSYLCLNLRFLRINGRFEIDFLLSSIFRLWTLLVQVCGMHGIPQDRREYKHQHDQQNKNFRLISDDCDTKKVCICLIILRFLILIV
jgi:hypothetical protein